MSPRFIDQLKPVDFKAVAAKGCFVYCYLRADGTPYYVGIASRASRPLGQHVCGIPRKRIERIRVLRSGLSREEAVFWERFYIARYGRMDTGAGILRNRTDGGDGNQNYGPDARAKMARANFTAHSEATAKWAGLSMQEWETLPKHERNKLRRRKRTENQHKSGEVRTVQQHHRASAEKSAKKLGLSASTWAGLDTASKNRARARYKLGYRGKDLLAGGRIANPRVAVKKQITAARKYNICPAIWALIDANEKNRVFRRWNDGERSQEDLLGASRQGKSKATAAYNLKQQKLAADRLGLSLAQFQSLTLSQRAVLNQYVKRNPDVKPIEYIAIRGWGQKVAA